MKKIVIGLDGSRASSAALAWTARVASATGANLIAVHSYHPGSIEVSPDDFERLRAEREELVAKHWLARAHEAGVPVETRVIGGDPRAALLDIADEEHPDLLVVGRTGAGGGPGFLHLGSVAEHIAHYADCPYAVIPASTDPQLDRIIVGVDGSAESSAAVRWTAEVAAAVGADVVAVSIEEPFAEWSWDGVENTWQHYVESQFDTWLAPLATAGVAVEPIVSRGLHPADGLLGLASSRAGDLLVVGARGAGGFAGLRVGGVATKLLHRAALPLVVVPPDDGA